MKQDIQMFQLHFKISIIFQGGNQVKIIVDFSIQCRDVCVHLYTFSFVQIHMCRRIFPVPL